MNDGVTVESTETMKSGIARLCRLSLTHPIQVRVDRLYHPERAQALIDSGLIDPGMAKEFGNREGFVEPFKSKENVPLDSDILGEYDSESHSIVIYEIPCKLASWGLSKSLGRMPNNDLLKVVTAHEISHAITHLGLDDRGSIWGNFIIAPKEDKELFAQIFALKYLDMRSEGSAVQVFRALATKQSQIYNTWKGIEDRSIEEIDNLLLEARRKELSWKRESDPFWNEIDENAIKEIVRDIMDLLAKEELEISSFELAWKGLCPSHLETVLKGMSKLPSNASVNVIPATAPGLCTPVLIVLMRGTISGFKKRLEEASEFVSNICPRVQHIVIWTPIWYSRTWREMSPEFAHQNVSIKVFGLNGQTLQSITDPQMRPNVVSSGSSIIEEICERCGRKSSLHKVEVRWQAQGFALDGGYNEMLCKSCSDLLVRQIRKGNVLAMNSIDLPCNEISIDGRRINV